MKTTTATYRAMMKRQIRPKSHLRIHITAGYSTYTYTDTEIISAIRLEDVDPLSRRLPKERFTFAILDFAGNYNPGNPSGAWAAIDTNSEVTVEWGIDANGSVSWLADTDHYLLDGRPEYNNGIASFAASSRLLHLTSTFYKTTVGQQSLGQLAYNIAFYEGLVPDYIEVDNSLYSMYTTAAVPIDSTRNLLQMIAHAGGCALYTRNGIVTLKKVDVKNLNYHTEAMTLRDVKINEDILSKLEPLYQAQAYKYSYETDTTRSIIYQNVFSTTGPGQLMHFEFDAAEDVQVTTSSGTVTYSQIYARAVDLSMDKPGTYMVTITGRKINQTATLSTATVGTDTAGGIDVENNRLVTDDALRQALIYRVANYLRYRITHTIGDRGNPEQEPGDGLHFSTDYGVTADGLILANTVTFDGALTGQIILKSLTEGTYTDADLYDSASQAVEDSDDEQVVVVGTEDYTSSYTGAEIDAFISAVLGV